MKIKHELVIFANLDRGRALIAEFKLIESMLRSSIANNILIF